MEAPLAKRDSNTSVVRGLIPSVAERENICMRTKPREAKEAAATAERCRVYACVRAAHANLQAATHTGKSLLVSSLDRRDKCGP